VTHTALPEGREEIFKLLIAGCLADGLVELSGTFFFNHHFRKWLKIFRKYSQQVAATGDGRGRRGGGLGLATNSPDTA
jgi:hypothetical protein